MKHHSFSARLTIALTILLFSYGAFVAVLALHITKEYQQESLQKLSQGLAQHIVNHWPQISNADPNQSDQAQRDALISMLMVVNPSIQVYILDQNGMLKYYLGDTQLVKQRQIDLNPINDFLNGKALPIRGTDPMGSNIPRIFSVAKLPARTIDKRPSDFLYIVLDGQNSDLISRQISDLPVWLSALMVGAIGLLVTLCLGALSFRQITFPLRHLARRMYEYSNEEGQNMRQNIAVNRGDEVKAIQIAFEKMTTRIESHALREQQQAKAHREMMASIAHDLRTPLTALHGHLEALDDRATSQNEYRNQLIDAALAQSNKVRRLSQQLFELATLQSSDQILHREVFCLDELVADIVHKFGLNNDPPQVILEGPHPGRIEIDGDLHLIERALSNLIDNAIRHATHTIPVKVSIRLELDTAQVFIQDSGPGLPEELQHRLMQMQSLRDPPIRRASGGLGGLGLAIAQQIAMLHGGSLLPLKPIDIGTKLCLTLPVQREL